MTQSHGLQQQGGCNELCVVYVRIYVSALRQVHAALESLSTSLSVESKMVRHGSAWWHESLAEFEWPRMSGGVFPVRRKGPPALLSFAEQTLPLEDFCRSVIGTNNKARDFLCLMSKAHPLNLFLGFPMGQRRSQCSWPSDASPMRLQLSNQRPVRPAADVGPGGAAPRHMHVVKPATPRAQPLVLRC